MLIQEKNNALIIRDVDDEGVVLISCHCEQKAHDLSLREGRHLTCKEEHLSKQPLLSHPDVQHIFNVLCDTAMPTDERPHDSIEITLTTTVVLCEALLHLTRISVARRYHARGGEYLVGLQVLMNDVVVADIEDALDEHDEEAYTILTQPVGDKDGIVLVIKEEMQSLGELGFVLISQIGEILHLHILDHIRSDIPVKDMAETLIVVTRHYRGDDTCLHPREVSMIFFVVDGFGQDETRLDLEVVYQCRVPIGHAKQSTRTGDHTPPHGVSAGGDIASHVTHIDRAVGDGESRSGDGGLPVVEDKEEKLSRDIIRSIIGRHLIGDHLGHHRRIREAVRVIGDKDIHLALHQGQGLPVNDIVPHLVSPGMGVYEMGLGCTRSMS